MIPFDIQLLPVLAMLTIALVLSFTCWQVFPLRLNMLAGGSHETVDAKQTPG